MRSGAGEVQITETRPFPIGLIANLLVRFDESERSSLLGDSAGFTLEDIREKVQRVNELTQAVRGIPSFPNMILENVLLRQEVEQIKQRLSELEERIPEEKVIVLKEISMEEAKEEIRQLFSSGRTLYYSDIAEELRLDLKLVVDICLELQASGEVEIDESVTKVTS